MRGRVATAIAVGPGARVSPDQISDAVGTFEHAFASSWSRELHGAAPSVTHDSEPQVRTASPRACINRRVQLNAVGPAPCPLAVPDPARRVTPMGTVRWVSGLVCLLKGGPEWPILGWMRVGEPVRAGWRLLRGCDE